MKVFTIKEFSEADSLVERLYEIIHEADEPNEGMLSTQGILLSKELVEKLWRPWQKTVRRNPAMRAISGTEDDITNVLLLLIEKFTPPSGLSFSKYPDWQVRNPQKSFDDWMCIVVANVVRDYARTLSRQPSTRALRLDHEPSPKRFLNEYMRSPISQRLSIRPPYTAKETVRKLLEHASTSLRGEQLRALAMWLEGGSFVEIGEALCCSGDEGRKLLRAAIAHLRRQFSS